jgi:2-oxoglutarate/2-oxoacid ferredoxin oxidoreductase subunit alpha
MLYMQTMAGKTIITDGSRLVIEAMARAGADSFIGYPITPANLLYQYGSRRFPLMFPAPDEITVLQWMAGLSACGRLPVTATSFPGFALMLESVNMAFMMELPMVIILVQRLGPATGTATCGAQGDISLLGGMISGGHRLPVLCPSDFGDCWMLSARAVALAAELRTPVVLLTSKEEMMTSKSFDISLLENIETVRRNFYDGDTPFISYHAGDSLVPGFLPVTDKKWQVRLNASTHDRNGILQHSNEEALDNTRRLDEKPVKHLDKYTFYDLDMQEGSDNLIVSYGITASAAREAVREIRDGGKAVSLLIVKTILPVPGKYYEIIDSFERVIIAEENINAQFASLLFGDRLPEKIVSVGGLGRMIGKKEIMEAVV